jgi:hypothetical protein
MPAVPRRFCKAVKALLASVRPLDSVVLRHMRAHMISILLASSMVAATAAAADRAPDCSSWPTNVAFVHLKNAGLTDNTQTNPEKASAVRLASEPIGKDLYRQIYRITFRTISGQELVVITSSEASSQECSMGAVDVFVVSRHLGGE